MRKRSKKSRKEFYRQALGKRVERKEPQVFKDWKSAAANDREENE